MIEGDAASPNCVAGALQASLFFTRRNAMFQEGLSICTHIASSPCWKWVYVIISVGALLKKNCFLFIYIGGVKGY